MRLIIGGQGQGKLSYILSDGFSYEDISFCGECPIETIFDKNIIYNGHVAVRELMEKNINPLDFFILNISEEMIIIFNEVGCGIVPMELFDREYRDIVGIICCELAKRACTVERIFCGIPQKIKEEPYDNNINKTC